MNKEIIATSDAPSAIGPYSQAVQSGNFIFLSGQIALDITGQIVSDEVQAQTHQVMKNIAAILKAAKTDFNAIVKTTIFLKDMNDFAAVNTVYASYFEGNFPARETVEVSRLPKEVRVEISVIAAV
ncbi:MAG: RidA family protein [Bacteroidetes bacterium]|nr:RidA family protein [Bacteroidota bacterium]MBK8660032.1 RidA family protein [Bacteroidota bacterium]